MHSETVKAALYDIRDNIWFVREVVGSLSRDDFIKSRLHFYAVTRALEIISEASRRLPNDLRNRHPHLPWRSIRDVGNFYRHQYDNVAASYVWETASGHLSDLLGMVLAEIQAD